MATFEFSIFILVFFKFGFGLKMNKTIPEFDNQLIHGFLKKINPNTRANHSLCQAC